MRWFCIAAAVAAAGCTKVEVRSSTRPGGALAALTGSWMGTWRSAGAAGTGTVAIQVRAFADKPVVRLQIDNPCLTPRSYAFVQTGTRVELRADGVPVFWGDLGAGKTLTGNYGCPEDHGSWMVTWENELPVIGDLSGTWHGSFAAATPPVQGAFVLELAQSWEDGLLVVEGQLTAPTFGIAPVPGRGLIEWRDTAFDLQFVTDEPTAPRVLLAGIGDTAQLRVVDGIATFAPDPRVPFRQALWQAALQR